MLEPITKARRYRASSGGNSNHERRIVALETKVDAMNTSVDKVKSDTAEILSLLTYTKSVSGFVRKHAPRVVAFGIGALIMTGKISAETGQNFLHLLGL